MIVNIAYNTTEPNIGLRLNRKSSALKCYMGDTGLLISLAFDEKGLVDEEVYKKILFNKFAFNEGMIMENIVAQMLTATGKNYTFSSLNKFRNKYKEYCGNRICVVYRWFKSGRRYSIFTYLYDMLIIVI